jgi:hypothetical protein
MENRGGEKEFEGVGREKSKYPKQKPIKMFGPKVLKFGPSPFILESFSSHPKKKFEKQFSKFFTS